MSIGGALELIQCFNNPKIIDDPDSSLQEGKFHSRWKLLTVLRDFLQLSKLFIVLKSKLSRTDRQTFRPRFRWEMLIHIWISPRHWKDASEEKKSLESDNQYVFLCLETQVYKYIYVIVDHWFFWVTGRSNH